MTIRFDLPDSLEECDDSGEPLDAPCFLYPAFEDRPVGIELWSPFIKYHVQRRTMTLNLRNTNMTFNKLTRSRFGQRRMFFRFRR